MEGRSSIRTIARRKHLSKTTVSLVVREIAKQAKGSIWIAKQFRPRWGHVLSVDGKFIRVFDFFAHRFQGTGAEKKWILKKTWIAGVDALTKDLPHYQIADGETKIDLYEYFTTLKKDIGYDLKVLVCDGNIETVETARMVYGSSVGIQLCVRHFIEGLKPIAKEEGQRKRKETEMLVGSIWAALGAKREDECFSRLKALTTVQETRCQKLIHQNLTKHIFLLTTHFRFHDRYYVPRYNNDVENLFKQLNLRLKSWNMFRSKTNAERYLSAWALARRFTKFTDCRGDMNRLKNGKSPLELTGASISGIDYLNL